jgi:hypothetical protein
MPTSDDDRYESLHRNYQDLAAGILRIREAVERAFDMTLPSATTMSGLFDQAIHDAAADRPRPAPTSTAADDKTTRTQFAYRIDVWTHDGKNILEHLAGLENLNVARAAHRAACERWPNARITLRQGTRIVEDSRR